MTSVIHKVCAILSMAAIVLSLSACAALQKPQEPYVKYTVAAGVVTISSAVTCYDSDAKARQAFLHWFKQGFETVLAGNQPMMITWQETVEGEAGRKGYDFGMDEGEKYMRNPDSPKSLQTAPIPQFPDPISHGMPS